MSAFFAFPILGQREFVQVMENIRQNENMHNCALFWRFWPDPFTFHNLLNHFTLDPLRNISRFEVIKDMSSPSIITMKHSNYLSVEQSTRFLRTPVNV